MNIKKYIKNNWFFHVTKRYPSTCSIIETELRIILSMYKFKNITMKTLNSKLTKDIFNEFALSNEEMIYVRGGEGDPIVKTSIPPVII